MSRTEKFSNEFNSATHSTQFLQDFDMGDHRTLVQLQRGNSGKTVLLLHNSPMNLNVWQPLFQTMQKMSASGAKTPNLVAYDLRGHGSAWMPVANTFNNKDPHNHAWSWEMFISDCKKIHEQVIGNQQIEVCGLGFGGIVAQKYALTFPNRISKLILLQTSIVPQAGLQEDIDYLGGPGGWIAQNPNVTYLTNNEAWVQKKLCEWFYLPDDPLCPAAPVSEEGGAKVNDEDAPQYNLTAAMWRQGSSTTTLQTRKMGLTANLVANWMQASKIPFNVHILTAKDDPLAPPSVMVDTYTTIYNNNRTLLVVFDIVDGKHGFSIMHPEYIAEIMCQDCQTIAEE